MADPETNAASAATHDSKSPASNSVESSDQVAATSSSSSTELNSSTSIASPNSQPPRDGPVPGAKPGPNIPSLRPSLSEGAQKDSSYGQSGPRSSLDGARRPPGAPQSNSSPANAAMRPSALNSDMAAKLKAFHMSRRGAPPGASTPGATPVPSGPGAMRGPPAGGPMMAGPGGFQMPPGASRPPAFAANSSPALGGARVNPRMPPGGGGGLAAKRGLNARMKLSDAVPDSTPAAGTSTDPSGGNKDSGPSKFSKYADIVDTATGTLRFRGKAVISSSGVEFSSGNSFSISLDEVDTLDELGKGNYGTVYKVRHSRPRVRKRGQGLAGNKAPPSLKKPDSTGSDEGHNGDPSHVAATAAATPAGSTTGLVMAMKEIRLELDDAKFAAIIMELDVLHRCVSPFIVDFYGAFFQEGAVYICMEFMDGGSIDKIYGDGIPENVLRKITLATTLGLKSLKDDHNIIHRDVKPTNILVNTRGQVKICDFGVSGNLVASIARTNIGCQSYMAPERIATGGTGAPATSGEMPGAASGSYSVQSDIWSLGLTIIECAIGRYPYPPETYNNIFSQLSAIVDGAPPNLPTDGYSDQARAFVASCLHKRPQSRPTYANLLRHPWLNQLLRAPAISEDAEAEEAAEQADKAEGASQTETKTSDSKAPAELDSAVVMDEEVAVWVKGALERRRQGKLQGASKPALHAAPLDAMPATPNESRQEHDLETESRAET